MKGSTATSVILLGIFLCTVPLLIPSDGGLPASDINLIKSAVKAERTATVEELLAEGNRYLHAGQVEMAIEKYNVALALAQKAQDTYKIAVSFSLLATVYTKQNQQRMAAEYYRQAVRLFRDLGETSWVVAHLFSLGVALTSLGQNEEALASYLEAFAVGKNHFQLEKESDREFLSGLMAAIVNASVQLGRAEEALRPLNEALEIFRQKGERKVVAKALDWIAKVYLKDPEKGLVFFAKELKRSQFEKDRYLESEITYQMGILLYEAKNSAKALHFQERALKLCRETNNLRRAIDVLGELGANYEKRGQSDKALEYYDNALRVSQGLEGSFNGQEKLDFLRSQGGTLLLIGQIYETREQYEKAVEFYRRARQSSVEAGDRQAGVGVLSRLGIAYSKLGRAGEALLAVQQWEEEEKEQRMLEWQIKALIHLAQSSDARGEIDNVQKYFFEALTVCENFQQAAPVLVEIGRLYQDMSRYDEALNFYHQALDKYRAAKDPKGEGEILARIGEVYRWFGDNENALRWYRDALETSKATRDIAGIAQTLAKLLLVEAWLGHEEAFREHVSEAEKAENELRERISLATQKSAAQQMVVMDDILALTRLTQVVGEIAARWGQPDQAISILNQALQVHQTLARTREILKETAVDLYFLGYAHSRLEQYDEALKVLKMAEEIARQLHSPELYWILNRTGSVQERQGKLQEALALYVQATEVLEKVSFRQRLEEVRLPVRELASQFYRNILGVQYKLYVQTHEQRYIEQAFFYYEKSKARNLLDLLEEAKVRVRKEMDPILMKEEEQITTRISRLHRALANPQLSRDQEKSLITSLEEQEQAWQALRVKIAAANPKYAELASPQIASIQQVQKILDEETLLLEYLLTEEKSFLWAVTQEGMQGYELPASEEFSRQLEEYLPTLKSPLYGKDEIKRHMELGKKLYSMLLQPAASQLQGKSKLIVIADGSLHYLPFETLIANGVENSTEETEALPVLQSVPYLVKTYTVTYAPSASVLVTLEKNRDKRRQEKASAQVPLLAFGDPLYESAPEPRAVALNVRGAYEERSGGFQRLEYSAQEVEKIAGVYEIPLPSDAVNLREKVTEKRLREMDLTRYRILHFATHAILSDEVKWITQPALVLSLTGADDGYDGFLQMGEIFNLRLNADLVALSACDTGKGKLLRGEGIFGLTRAFMYAGTPSVVASLWKVNDQSTSLFMEFFYRNLKDGQSKAEALRQAKKQLMQTQVWSDALKAEQSLAAPYFWAPFILVGSGN